MEELDNLFPKDDLERIASSASKLARFMLSKSSDPKVTPHLRIGFLARAREIAGDNLSFIKDETLLGIFDRESHALTDKRGSFTETTKTVVLEAVSEAKNKVELEKWPFRVLKASKIGDLLRLTLEMGPDGHWVPMTMEVKDMYSQQRFRERYTVATGLYLDRIKNAAFEEFLSKLDIEDIQDTGTSAAEMVQDVLDNQLMRVREAESEEEADESLRARGMTKRGGILRFRLNKLKNEYEIKQLKPNQLAQCLKDAGAKQSGRGVWEYKKPEPTPE